MRLRRKALVSFIPGMHMTDFDKILDRPTPKNKELLILRPLFGVATLLLLIHFIIRFIHGPYPDLWLLASGILYETIFLFRLFFGKKRTPFYILSYLFFLTVIPGYLMDHFSFNVAVYVMYFSLIFPAGFLGIQLWQFIVKPSNS
jgi:hypothetical protein